MTAREMGQSGDYIGLLDKFDRPIHIGDLIRIDGLGEDGKEIAVACVWYFAPEVVARRLDPETLEPLEGSYSLLDWGHGETIPEFTVLEGEATGQAAIE